MHEALLSTFQNQQHTFFHLLREMLKTVCRCAVEMQRFTQCREWKTGYVIQLTDSIKITQKEQQISVQDNTYFIVL